MSRLVAIYLAQVLPPLNVFIYLLPVFRVEELLGTVNGPTPSHSLNTPYPQPYAPLSTDALTLLELSSMNRFLYDRG